MPSIDWTAQLGDAFLAQGDDVMSAVSSACAREAYRAGTPVRSNARQRVIVSESGNHDRAREFRLGLFPWSTIPPICTAAGRRLITRRSM